MSLWLNQPLVGDGRKATMGSRIFWALAYDFV